jgi:hypothetical protein
MRGAFRRCAEEDSNLHPVIPDQALNLVWQVSYASIPCQIVQHEDGPPRSSLPRMNTPERATRGGPPSWQSITSTILDDLDASDDPDVATDRESVGSSDERT